jgi:hypothetical protein
MEDIRIDHGRQIRKGTRVSTASDEATAKFVSQRIKVIKA